ncbi:VOC family protein [Sphingomonas tabacisoli]|uniref:Aldoketomutase n=1 Tax=Sphingomonas tabacisoli TaxID=2249466 RepID=A0ABW4I6R5_9SPHN
MIRSASITGLLCALAASPVAAQQPATSGQVLGPALRSSDLDRSARFYTAGLGMVKAGRIEAEGATEVFFAFEGARRGPLIVLFKSNDPAKATPIDHGNGYGRTILRVPDVAASSTRLRAVGYAPGEIRVNAVHKSKIMFVKDPDGYSYELVEASGGGE